MAVITLAVTETENYGTGKILNWIWSWNRPYLKLSKFLRTGNGQNLNKFKNVSKPETVTNWNGPNFSKPETVTNWNGPNFSKTKNCWNFLKPETVGNWNGQNFSEPGTCLKFLKPEPVARWNYHKFSKPRKTVWVLFLRSHILDFSITVLYKWMSSIELITSNCALIRS